VGPGGVARGGAGSLGHYHAALWNTTQCTTVQPSLSAVPCSSAQKDSTKQKSRKQNFAAQRRDSVNRGVSQTRCNHTPFPPSPFSRGAAAQSRAGRGDWTVSGSAVWFQVKFFLPPKPCAAQRHPQRNMRYAGGGGGPPGDQLRWRRPGIQRQ
jgi:hypothetical protein